jgi:hypothetical protein
MAGQRWAKRNRRSRNAKARRRRVVGLGATAGAFLAFGMTLLAIAPPARADAPDPLADLGGSPAGDTLLGLGTVPLDKADQMLDATFPSFAESLDQFVNNFAVEVWPVGGLPATPPDADPFSDLIGAPETWTSPITGVTYPIFAVFDSFPLGAGTLLDQLVDGFTQAATPTPPAVVGEEPNPFAEFIGSPAGDTIPGLGTVPLDQADQMLDTNFPSFAVALQELGDALSPILHPVVWPVGGLPDPPPDADPFSDLIGAPDTWTSPITGVTYPIFANVDILPINLGIALDQFVDSIGGCLVCGVL